MASLLTRGMVLPSWHGVLLPFDRASNTEPCLTCRWRPYIRPIRRPSEYTPYSPTELGTAMCTLYMRCWTSWRNAIALANRKSSASLKSAQGWACRTASKLEPRH
ncbi:hypothetical protein TPAR_04332 [Tolypocladium paradoxum]|uniref:Uncharacterized protein n=1 Tax=Tolypocladium paradoxum TaxID=94208 RepID=A0A2S4KZ57_9HYPO|nr:hypothetical protein TPAR_04332 [Tolypocladium paradoxum]